MFNMENAKIYKHVILILILLNILILQSCSKKINIKKPFNNSDFNWQAYSGTNM